MTDDTAKIAPTPIPSRSPAPAHVHEHVHDENCNHGPDGHGHHHHAPVTTLRRASPKVGRNEACPCGSGKKHKKCCLA